MSWTPEQQSVIRATVAAYCAEHSPADAQGLVDTVSAALTQAGCPATQTFDAWAILEYVPPGTSLIGFERGWLLP